MARSRDPRDQQSRGAARSRRRRRDKEADAPASGALAELGAEVGDAVGGAIRQVASQLEKSVSSAVEARRSDQPAPRRRAPEPRRGRGEVQLLWGLLTVGFGGDGGRFGVVWGLVELRYRSGELMFQALWGLVRIKVGLPSGGARRRAEAPQPPQPPPATPEPRAARGSAQVAPAATPGASEAQPSGPGADARDHARAMQNLSASIAHEIRNPITAAKSLVQQMGEDPSSTENVEYADVALRELERVERSVSHLLRFARDEEFAMGEIRLAEVLESAVAGVKDQADRSGVRLCCEVDTPGAMRGDAEKLRRVIINLVRNAIEALAEAETESPRVELQMGESLAGTEVWLRVRDNGPGIAEERHAEIFAPFRTSKSTGTGLGLAITKKLVDAHGGTIELTSSPGHGAEFVVTFPKAGTTG